LDLLPFIGTVSLPFLALRPEDICFCDDCKLQDRIFVSLVHLSVADHDLSRQKLMIVVIRIETVQSLIHDVRGKALCTCSRSGQQNDPVSVFLIMLQIFDQKFKAVVIRIHAFDMNAILSV